MNYWSAFIGAFAGTNVAFGLRDWFLMRANRKRRAELQSYEEMEETVLKDLERMGFRVRPKKPEVQA